MELRNIIELKKKRGVDPYTPGDTVKVSYRVVEGSRERIQVFEGVVIRVREGGIDANFTVRRVSKDGIGVERTFLHNSPRLEKLEVTRRGRVRRANLYYLRGLTGKAARLKDGGRIVRAADEDELDPAAAAVPEVAELETDGDAVESADDTTAETGDSTAATGDEAASDGTTDSR